MSSVGTRACARGEWGKRRSTAAISVLRAALAQTLRWEWVGSTPASQAVLRQPKVQARDAMTADDVRAAIAAAHDLEPAAGVALRLAAVAGLRRAELAALQWTDLAGKRLTVDSSATTSAATASRVDDLATKTGNRRTLTLDPATVDAINELRVNRQQISPYLFCDTTGPTLARACLRPSARHRGHGAVLEAQLGRHGGAAPAAAPGVASARWRVPIASVKLLT